MFCHFVTERIKKSGYIDNTCNWYTGSPDDIADMNTLQERG